MSRAITPSSELELPRSPRASRFGRYPSCAARSITRWRVASPIGTPLITPFSTRDTVVVET